jgi:hypothetical protein
MAGLFVGKPQQGSTSHVLQMPPIHGSNEVLVFQVADQFYYCCREGYVVIIVAPVLVRPSGRPWRPGGGNLKDIEDRVQAGLGQR